MAMASSSSSSTTAAALQVTSLELPPPLTSTTPGTWAYDTMSRRVLENIVQGTVVADNEHLLDNAARGRISLLEAELANAAETKLEHILHHANGENETSSNDEKAWRQLMQPYVERGDTWLSAPWLVTEFYLYRRILHATGYFDAKAPLHLHDPFALQKKKGLAACASAMSSLAPRVNAFAATDFGDDLDAKSDQLRLFVMLSLWGNRMDLSIWPSEGDGAASSARAAKAVEAALAESASNLLHDDADNAMKVIVNARRVDIVVDNAGFELVTDLALADALACAGGEGACVTLRVKGHPTYVSDVILEDVFETIDTLAASKEEAVAAMATRWKTHMRSGRWVVAPHDYWAQGFPFWTMPEDVVAAVSGADAVILKGDANYRRLLGDLQWPLSTPFAEVAGYMPAPTLALRTLKAELGCGMAEDRVAYAKAESDDWMVSGRFGVVQFWEGVGAGESCASVRAARTKEYFTM